MSYEPLYNKSVYSAIFSETAASWLSMRRPEGAKQQSPGRKPWGAIILL